METRYFLATQDGILKPVEDTDQIANFNAQSTPTLTATEATVQVEITVFFPQAMSKPMMQQALRAAAQTVQSNIPHGAVTEHILFFVRSNWKELAFTAYKNYLRVGRGCLYFGEGIISKDSFQDIRLEYVSHAQFMEMHVSDVAKHLVDTYDPSSSVFVFIQQQDPFWLVAGANFGLPAPKAVWEQYKDDPSLSGLLMSIFFSAIQRK